MADETLTLTEIAARIDAHLQRIEKDPVLNPTFKRADGEEYHRYYNASSWRSGNRAWVRLRSYQGGIALTKAEATAYLEWLDAGNVGGPWDQQWGGMRG